MVLITGERELRLGAGLNGIPSSAAELRPNRPRPASARDWELDLMKREQLSKGEPINCSGSRSRTTKRAAPPREGAPTRAKIVICKIPSSGEQSISGSDSPDFSNLLIDQVANVLGREPDDFEKWGRQTDAMLAAIAGIEPRDEIEGMLVAQLIASHNAAMECEVDPDHETAGAAH